MSKSQTIHSAPSAKPFVGGATAHAAQAGVEALEAGEPASSAKECSVFDAIVVGAGAAGLFCAAQAGLGGARVLVIDHSPKLAEKIRISGGGRCNFTNRLLDVRTPERHFISENPRFCRSALSRFTPQDFVSLLKQHGIAFHEKHQGQLFCDGSAQEVIAMLHSLCQRGGVHFWRPCAIERVRVAESDALPSAGANASAYLVQTARGSALAKCLVVATGGLSIPKLGASDLGYRLAEQFAVPMVPPRPGLVPLRFASEDWAPFAQLAGLALPVEIAAGLGRTRTVFREDLLFTHRGLSGPAILQISNYWHSGEELEVNLLPNLQLATALLELKNDSRRQIANVLATWLPGRLAQAIVATDARWQRPIDQAADKALQALALQLQQWRVRPSCTEGYAKAEVTLGGVDTRALSSQTMECTAQPGLYFIGEVVDVTGWLGGYNFQWAWSSAHACARALVQSVNAQQ